MQPIKDSFFMTLCARLAQVNPARTIGNPARPAVLACENEKQDWLATTEAFYLRWLGDGTVAADALAAGWRSLRCEIGYRTQGTDFATGVDRGRMLAQFDDELKSMLSPRSAGMKDYSQAPEADLGRLMLWTAPKFLDAEDGIQGLQRTVQVEILWREDA